MRTFNYSAIKEQKWDSDVLGLIAAIYKEAGKQELYLKQRPEELEKLVEIAKIQSTEASNAIEGIVTTSTRIRQLVEEKTTPRNRDEQEIAGYQSLQAMSSFMRFSICASYSTLSGNPPERDSSKMIPSEKMEKLIWRSVSAPPR